MAGLSLEKSTARVLEALRKWMIAMSDNRCHKCGARVGRTPEEVELYATFQRHQQVQADESRRFPSEAPTLRRKKQ